MIHHAQFEEWVPFPLEQVFLFFVNPENLPRIMPPARHTRIERLNLAPPTAPTAVTPAITQPLAGVGSEIVTSFRIVSVLPLRAWWIARVTEFEWNHHFADIQGKGPFKSWHHRHEFEQAWREGVSGTVVRDRIEYEIGFGVLGAIAQKLFVGRQMACTFRHRQRVLESLLRGQGTVSPS